MLFTKSLRRSYDEMLQEAMVNLQNKSGLTNFSAGSIARSLLEVYYEDYDKVNDLLEYSVAIGFLSSAEGEFVDEIGKLFDIKRLPGEDDENYKYRIHKHNETKAKANKTAIRLACLSIEGVHNVEMKRYIKGVGTFGVYVITDNPETPEDILQNVQEAIDATQAYGMKGEAIRPKLVYLDLNILYNFYDNAKPEIKEGIITKAETTLREYLINKPLGSELIINQLINLLMEIDKQNIKNLTIREMRINNKQTIINDKQFYWDERIVPGNIKIS